MITVALIGCGKAKRPGRHRARDLYTGPLFRAALAHAERTAARVFVLSALHGLLSLDAELDAYEQRLAGTGEQRQAWGRAVVDRLLAEVPGVLDVTIYAGADYAAPLVVPLVAQAERVAEVHLPLGGLTQGARLAWFARAREGRAA